jgi:hypothetical protein
VSGIPNAALRSAAIAVLCCSCGGSSPTRPPAAPSPSPTPAALPSPSPTPSASPGTASCPFAPGPVTRLAIAPRALQTNGAPAPMRTRLAGPGEEVLCLESEKSHRLDFNLNQRNALGQESCWEGFPSYRIRGDTERMVTGTSPIDDNGFVFRVRVEPRGQEAGFGVEAELDGIFSHPWLSGGQYPREPLRVITLAGELIPGYCPCVYLGNGGYEGGSCVR